MVAGWPPLAHLRQIGGGRALEQPARKAIAAASAVGLLTAAAAGAAGYFPGGRAMQRVWLMASARHLTLHPILSVLPFLFAGREGAAREVFAEELPTLAGLRRDYARCFSVPSGHAELLVFRLARAEPPSASSLRRPLNEVLTFH